MKLFGYEFATKKTLINGGVVVVIAVVNGIVVYNIVSGGCPTADVTISGTDADYFSCDYLKGLFDDECPTGFPSTYELCLSGFRQGIDLVLDGVTEFIPALLDSTVCNNHFGFNVSLQTCYDNLNDECWAGAWGGFGWKSTIEAISTTVSTDCEKVATYAASAAAGLTFFAGLARSSVSALWDYCGRQETGSDLEAKLLQEEAEIDHASELAR